MKRQSVRVELFPLKKEEILAYLDDKRILVNSYFKTYLAHPAYQEVVERQECLVEIVSLADMGFDREVTAPQLDEFTFPRSVYLHKVDQDLWLRVARFDDEYAFPLTTLFAFVAKNVNEFVVGNEP
ncbi:hypothetical protein MKL26_06070 [Streptococcus suis]|nr:hypothetical protein [Streptococcus suis]